MNDHDLHDQLERLGRRPVPPPRPEFVESLLARIQLTDDLREPAPVIYMRRQRWARARVAVAGAAAAVLLGAVGVLAMARGGSDSEGTGISVGLASNETGLGFNAEVSEGHLENPDSVEFGELTGTYTATCREGGRVTYGDGAFIDCQTGDKLILELEDGRIVEAWPGDDVADEPTVVTQDSSETSTTAQRSFPLEGVSAGGGVELSWAAPPNTEVASYAIERAEVADPQAPPPSILAPTGAPRQEVPASKTAAHESFADLQPSVGLRVAYRVFALDRDGKVVAMSGNTVNVDWQPSSSTTTG